jgi:hypothetical protein
MMIFFTFSLIVLYMKISDELNSTVYRHITNKTELSGKVYVEWIGGVLFCCWMYGKMKFLPAVRSLLCKCNDKNTHN